MRTRLPLVVAAYGLVLLLIGSLYLAEPSNRVLGLVMDALGAMCMGIAVAYRKE